MKKLFRLLLATLTLPIGVQAQNVFPTTGNVGIGTNAPSAPLSLGSSMANSKLALWDSGGVRYGFGIQGNQFRLHLGASINRFSFLNSEAGTEVMTLTGTGNLGIGTASPTASLDVSRGAGLDGTAAFRGSSFVSHFNYNTTENTYLRAGKAGAGVYINDAHNGNVMLASGGGNVGIGTTTPASKLNVNGTLQVDGGATTINFTDVVGTTIPLTLSDNISSLTYGTNTYGRLIRLTRNGYTHFYDIGLDNQNEFFINVKNSTTQAFKISANGNVGIGTTNPGTMKLAVEGTIGARAVKVTTTPAWPDFVFAKAYDLRPLSEVESYIQANQHLPEVPSADEVAKDGIDLGQMDAILLKKIEELTLYMIEQNKKLEAQNRQLQDQNKKIQALEELLSEVKK